VHAAREACGYAHTPLGYAVLRCDEVAALLRDRHLRQGSAAPLAAQGVTEGLLADCMRMSLLNLEGETHARLRRLVSQALTSPASTTCSPRLSRRKRRATTSGCRLEAGGNHRRWVIGRGAVLQTIFHATVSYFGGRHPAARLYARALSTRGTVSRQSLSRDTGSSGMPTWSQLVRLTVMSSSLRASQSLPTGLRSPTPVVPSSSSPLSEGIHRRDLLRGSCKSRPNGGGKPWVTPAGSELGPTCRAVLMPVLAVTLYVILVSVSPVVAARACTTHPHTHSRRHELVVRHESPRCRREGKARLDIHLLHQ
jgi:hypothetical protein